MVSFQTAISPEFDHSLSMKRKREDTIQTDHHRLHHHLHDREAFDKRIKPGSTKSIFDIELHLETPLPVEWERCLDIQSGEIHFYNTRTQKRTSGDPRGSSTNTPDQSPRPKPPPPPQSSHDHMSLDLELNLPCDHSSSSSSQRKTNNNLITRHVNNNIISGDHLSIGDNNHHQSQQKKKNISGDHQVITRCPSWLEFETGGDDQQEMVATVCMKCHMLVMLCKSSPTCPNCKFVHPPDQSPPNLFKPRLSLLC